MWTTGGRRDVLLNSEIDMGRNEIMFIDNNNATLSTASKLWRKRVHFPAVLLASLLVIGCTTTQAAAPISSPSSSAPTALSGKSWSVLLITVDNLRPDRMSVYGYGKDTTPYLKRFAEESAVFENAFSASAWTAPGMVSIFTGYYPPVHAQSGRFSYYDKEMTSALRVLARAGYEILGQAIRGPSHEDFGFQGWVGKLEDFVEERATNTQPFFAWAHIKNVHLPYAPSEANAKRFGATGRTSEAIEAVRSYRIILRHPEKVQVEFKHAGKVEFSDEDVAETRALYDGEVADVDEHLSQVLERMRETGLLDRTIVIVSADHGEELFDHGWLGHASTGYDGKLYDELIRIPLIIRVPDGSLIGRFSALAQGVDIMPTVFNILDIDDQGMAPGMQGRSLLPVMTGEASKIRDFVFTQTTYKGWTTPKEEIGIRPVSVRSATHKLIWFPSETGTRVEGYDLRQDPDEIQNLYPERAAEFNELKQALKVWSEENRRKAAQLVLDGADRRLVNIASAALGEQGLKSAVNEWLAIQTMEETWGLEPDPFYVHEAYAARWDSVQSLAATMISKAMACSAKTGTLSTDKPSRPTAVDAWACKN